MLMGGTRDGDDAVEALCLGADGMQRRIRQCVTRIATQDPELDAQDRRRERHAHERRGRVLRHSARSSNNPLAKQTAS